MGSRPLTSAELQTACDLAVSEGTLTETEGHFLARLLLGVRILYRANFWPQRNLQTGFILDSGAPPVNRHRCQIGTE